MKGESIGVDGCSLTSGHQTGILNQDSLATVGLQNGRPYYKFAFWLCVKMYYAWVEHMIVTVNKISNKFIAFGCLASYIVSQYFISNLLFGYCIEVLTTSSQSL